MDEQETSGTVEEKETKLNSRKERIVAASELQVMKNSGFKYTGSLCYLKGEC